MQSAAQATTTSERGRASVITVIENMHKIRAQAVETAERIRALNDLTSKVGSIIAAVNEVAYYSRLVALNAAIEAARAGEHGRGFAVVAGEIRSLAEQSRAATSEVRSVLGEIEADAELAARAAEESMQRSELGLAMAEASRERLEELTQSMSLSSASAVRIAQTARDQVHGIEQAARSLVTMATATYATTTRAHEASSVTDRLAELANELLGSTAKPH